MTTKTKKLGYWIATGLAAAGFLAGGLADLTHAADVDATMVHLGFPLHVATLLGIWKILGAIALVAPRLPRLKEWAYAGIAFDLTGAAWAHAAVGDGASAVVTPLVLLGIAAASWALRPADRRLDVVAPARDEVRPVAAPALRAA
jgi:uncharacterized membrane protein YphA (DoxX/SURF4 family)